MSQIQKLKEPWSNLIILDAARYDYFEKQYPQHLNGKLEKVTSPASCTELWLPACWSGYYDVTYVSGSPYVNSAGVSIGSYVAKRHFKKIIDVWKFGWDDKLETIPPEAVSKASLDLTDRENLIIHYMQPHWPYIGETRVWAGSGRRRRAFTLKEEYNKRGDRFMTRGDNNISQLRKAYSENLDIVLASVAKMTPLLKGRTIITADHGELLGEHEDFYHPCPVNHPILREVPWFEVIK